MDCNLPGIALGYSTPSLYSRLGFSVKRRYVSTGTRAALLMASFYAARGGCHKPTPSSVIVIVNVLRMGAPGNDCNETAAADLDDLFRAHYGRITKLAARITRDPGRAEELAVEVFLRWAASRNKNAEAAVGWLCRTAIHLALDECRRRSRRERLRRFVPSFLAATPNPEQILDSADRCRMVVAVLERLAPRDAELLLLRADGMSYQELANALSLHTASVGKLLSRAKNAFQKEYHKKYGQHE